MSEYDVYAVQHRVGTFMPTEITRQYIERNGCWYHRELGGRWHLSSVPLSRIDTKHVSTPVGVAEHAGRVKLTEADFGTPL